MLNPLTWPLPLWVMVPTGLLGIPHRDLHIDLIMLCRDSHSEPQPRDLYSAVLSREFRTRSQSKQQSAPDSRLNLRRSVALATDLMWNPAQSPAPENQGGGSDLRRASSEDSPRGQPWCGLHCSTALLPIVVSFASQSGAMLRTSRRYLPVPWSSAAKLLTVGKWSFSHSALIEVARSSMGGGMP